MEDLDEQTYEFEEGDGEANWTESEEGLDDTAGRVEHSLGSKLLTLALYVGVAIALAFILLYADKNSRKVLTNPQPSSETDAVSASTRIQ